MSPQNPDRIKIAVQKSGRLTEHSLDLLARCGLKYSKGRDQLICYGENLPIDVLLVRDDDIPGLVRDDVCDLGIVGANVLEEKRLAFAAAGDTAPFTIVRKLDFGHCRLSFAVPEDMPWQGPADLAGRRIATSYPHIVGEFLRRQGLEASVVEFSGAVEIAPKLGRADVICDLVSTGGTLRANHLREEDTILDSVSSLIQTPKTVPAGKAEWMERLKKRIDGVIQVSESKYIMLHAPRAALAEITRLLPGSEAPTVMPLEGREDKVAIHAVCRENVFWETLEELKQAGASSMLVLPVEKMLY